MNYLLRENPDIIINIVDATCIERSLYLTTQLLELNAKVIVALNMTDVLSKKGIKIDVPILERELNVKVCEISALKETGIDKLIDYINQVANLLKKNGIFIKNDISIKNYTFKMSTICCKVSSL